MKTGFIKKILFNDKYCSKKFSS